MSFITKNDVKICVFGDSIGKGVIQQKESGRYGLVKIDLPDLVGQANIILDNFFKDGQHRCQRFGRC